MSMQGNNTPSIWYKLVHMEPALWRGLIMAVFTMLASFGILVSDDVPNNLIALVLALAAIIQALWTRQAVVPEEKVVVWKDDKQNLRAGEAVPNADTFDVKELVTAAKVKGKVL